MSNCCKREGIALAGNIIADSMKMVDVYPKEGMLCNILSVSQAVGGCVPNTGIDLAKIDPSLPLYAYGRVGNDGEGRFLTGELSKYGFDVSGVRISDTKGTSFDDNITVASTGARTFFHYGGADAEFCPSDIDVASLRCRMLHIGYILLLDEFDKPDPEYGTVMARFLKSVQEADILTSIDVVSDSTGKFAEKVLPALKYTDNAIMNEIECCTTAGLEARDENGKLIVPNIRKAMEHLMKAGIRQRLIVHCPEAGFILNNKGEFTVAPSVFIKKSDIVGAVGAGDAFCAGCLYAIYNGYSDLEILDFASAAAICNLTAEDSISGMKPKEYIWDLVKNTGREESPV